MDEYTLASWISSLATQIEDGKYGRGEEIDLETVKEDFNDAIESFMEV